MSHPPGFLDPRDARALALARRRAETITERRVLDHLEWCARQYGQATPSVEGLARRCHRSQRQVIRATGSLARAGHLWIDCDRVHRRADGTYYRARTNRYRFRFPDKTPDGTDMTRVTRLQKKSVKSGPGGRRSVDNVQREKPPELELTLGDEPPGRPPWQVEGISRQEWVERNR